MRPSIDFKFIPHWPLARLAVTRTLISVQSETPLCFLSKWSQLCITEKQSLGAARLDDSANINSCLWCYRTDKYEIHRSNSVSRKSYRSKEISNSKPIYTFFQRIPEFLLKDHFGTHIDRLGIFSTECEDRLSWTQRTIVIHLKAIGTVLRKCLKHTSLVILKGLYI